MKVQFAGLTATLLVLSLFPSCAGSSNFMARNATPGPQVPPPGQAMVVFVRPGGLGAALSSTVLDGTGAYVGQIPAKGHVKHVVPPGSHRFLAWSETTSVLDAELAADKTYYVEVDMDMGWWSGRTHMYGVRRGSKNWDRAERWTADTNEWQRSSELTEAWSKKKSDGIPGQLQRAEEKWNDYSEPEKARRSLSIDDGR